MYLGIFVYHSLVMMLNVVCYLDGIKYSGSTVRAADPFLSLSRECKYEIYFQGSEELNLNTTVQLFYHT